MEAFKVSEPSSNVNPSLVRKSKKITSFPSIDKLSLLNVSVKKYHAMQNAVCDDGRAHGMFQFYGANRSGRWAGRLIQLQNLPQNHMKDLADARELVRSGDYETLNLLYDDIPDTLSQLIRTAFIPKPGYKFIVSDFSAIEARVLSYLAGETWRSKVFAEGKDILLPCALRSSSPISFFYNIVT